MEKILYQSLKEEIFTFKLISGQKLQYQDIADQYNVSRTIVKNALTLLNQEGLVTLYPQKGYYVTELSGKEAEDLFELRTIIEMTTVKKAIENFSREGYHELYHQWKRFADVVEQKVTEGLFLVDRDFHLQIANMGGNQALVKYLKNVMEVLFLRYRVEGLSIAKNESAVQEHLNIYKAVGLKNVDAAVEALKIHFECAKGLLK